MHTNKWVSKRESEHSKGEWVYKREGGNSNSNRASAIRNTGVIVPTTVAASVAARTTTVVTAGMTMAVTVGTVAAAVGAGTVAVGMPEWGQQEQQQK